MARLITGQRSARCGTQVKREGRGAATQTALTGRQVMETAAPIISARPRGQGSDGMRISRTLASKTAIQSQSLVGGL